MEMFGYTRIRSLTLAIIFLFRTPISENNVRQLQDQAPAPTNSKVKCDVCLLIFKSETGYGQHLSSMLHSIGMKNRRYPVFQSLASFSPKCLILI